TEPSLLKGVISATNEPVNTFFDIAISMPQIAAVHSVDRFRMAGLPKRCGAGSISLYGTVARTPTAFSAPRLAGEGDRTAQSQTHVLSSRRPASVA
ncbi:MAG TPA: hypothetical protein VFQ33_06890, partial [Xanthobacteraceae bacterium]|nr:hypothetical protein [Xanthobacteraceae bacterium]